jgi:AraC-like DNA-binding protein
VLPPLLPKHFIANLTQLIEKNANRSINLFSHIVGMWSGTIRRLLVWDTKLSMRNLCQLCSGLNISPVELLIQQGNEEALERRHLILERNTPLPKTITPWSQIEDKLNASLLEQSPPSMEAVARRMGYSPSRIKGHFPDLCKLIISRYKEYLKNTHPLPKEIRRVLRSALKEYPPPALQRVLRRLDCYNTGYYYYHNYHDLCRAVANRYKDYRNKPFNRRQDSKFLRNVLSEAPPPSFSEAARRLGHTREFVRQKFPEIAKSITSRHMQYRKVLREEKAVKLRQVIREAIVQITDSGLYVSEARVKEYAKGFLPSTGRSTVFKQALREIKTEMGLTG